MGAQQTGATNIGAVLAAAKARLVIDLRGIHGIRHWTRVRENGHRLARHTGANKEVVELFASVHDCCRENDRYDLGHGERAAEFASSLRGTLIHLSDDTFALLYEAVRDHEKVRRDSDDLLGRRPARPGARAEAPRPEIPVYRLRQAAVHHRVGLQTEPCRVTRFTATTRASATPKRR